MLSIPNYQIIEFLDWLRIRLGGTMSKTELLDWVQSQKGESKSENSRLLRLSKEYLLYAHDKRRTRIWEKTAYDSVKVIIDDFLEWLQREHAWYILRDTRRWQLSEEYLSYIRDKERFRLWKQENEHNRIRIDLSRYSLENESERLVRSTRELLSDKRKLEEVKSMLSHPEGCVELMIMYPERYNIMLSDILNFFDWIRNQYPELNLSGDIPLCKLNDLIDEFCKNKNTPEANSLKKQIKRMFKESRNGNFISKIREWFTNNGNKTEEESNPFDRYSRVKFHGMFLFPKGCAAQLNKFIEESWQDLNSMTGEWIDIYYSKKDVKDRTCYDVRDNIKRFDKINNADLPAFIIWDNDFENTYPIPISDLENKKILTLIAHLVDSIRNDKSLSEVVDDGMNFIREELRKNEPNQINIQNMGDIFELNNANNITLVNRSKVDNAFNNNSDNCNENLANVIKEIGKIVETSKNKDANVLFKEFTKELDKKQPSKPKLRSFWNSLKEILPILSTTASIAETIMEIIN